MQNIFFCVIIPNKKGEEMKKVLFFLILTTSFIWASSVNKKNYFLSINGGITDVYTSKSCYSVGIGTYYKFENKYDIINRFTLGFNYIDSSADFYITNFKVDWIKNVGFLSPYLGINIGYMYYNQNNNDFSSTVLGFQGGVIIPVTNNIEIELSAIWQKAVEKQNIWYKSIRTYKGGLNFKF